MKTEMIQRVQIWTEQLRADILTPVLTVPLHRMTTLENLGFARVHDLVRAQRAAAAWPDRAQDGEGESGVFYARYPAPWGRKWEYGWFWGEIDLKGHADLKLQGARLELLPDVGGEMLVEVNGVLRGARDLQHETIPLTPCATGDETFSILIESYAGHGPRLENGGPLLYGWEAVPEPPLHQVRTGLCQLCVRNEAAYGLYMDLQVLLSLYRTLEPRSLRAQQVLEARVHDEHVDRTYGRQMLMQGIRASCEGDARDPESAFQRHRGQLQLHRPEDRGPGDLLHVVVAWDEIARLPPEQVHPHPEGRLIEARRIGRVEDVPGQYEDTVGVVRHGVTKLRPGVVLVPVDVWTAFPCLPP